MKADRARQFLPFAALKGFDEMLREIEKKPEPKRELTEEDLRLLNEKIKSVGKGSNVRIVHYEKMHIQNRKGKYPLLIRYSAGSLSEKKVSLSMIS